MHDAALARCLALSRQARALQGGAGADSPATALANTLTNTPTNTLTNTPTNTPTNTLADTLASLEAALEQLVTHGADAAESQPDAVLELDLSGYVKGWNSGAAHLFGYTAQEAVGQHVLFLYAPDDEDQTVAELTPRHPKGYTDVRRCRKSGEAAWLRLANAELQNDRAEVVGMLVMFNLLDDPLSEADKVHLHARIIEDSDQGVLITDANERIVSINNAFTRITGYTPAEAIGQTPDLLRSGIHDAEFRVKVRAAMQGQGPWRGEIMGRRKNGELFPQSVTISVVRDQHGRISHTFSLFSDISVHKDAEARMQRMANYDALTGLPNLCLLSQLMGQALTEARRSREHGALLVIEVSRIGAISDTLGHEIGNELLCEIGRLFRLSLREADVLAKLDGNRFAVALLHIEKREHAAIVAQKLMASLEAPIVIDTHRLQVGAHVGITIYPEDGTETPALMRCADVATSKAGQAVESGFLFYSEEMNQRAKEHLRLESELRQALVNGELQLYYQPKVSLRTGRIMGAEALLRWRHPARGMVSPGVFIPVAEETGLILELGNWVLEEACRQLHAWREAGVQAPAIAVNLSGRQFDSQLPERLAELLERRGVLPEQLMLEITESLLVRGTENVIAIMNKLVAMGMALALDDFGTGYSSLAYLKKFPISTLKIDRSFVIGLPDEENDCAIARAIVTMARQLRQEIVAEGVETPEQMAFLRGLGCHQLQGFLFSPAVPAAEFATMLREDRRLTVEMA